MALKLSQIKKLHNGDQITWSDPDAESDCSKVITIKTINWSNPEVISITGIDQNNNYQEIECLPKELS